MRAEQQKQKTVKVIIAVLSVLLGISLLLLAGTLIYNRFANSAPASVVVPNNVITPEEDGAASEQPENLKNSEALIPSAGADTVETGEAADFQPKTGGDTAAVSDTVAPSGTETAEVTAPVLSLYKRNAEDNTPYQVTNMFPGDAETKYYCVRVSYSGDVVVRFHADIRQGYEKLAEVLKCRITMPESGETLYDGLMRDMPASLNHELKTQQSTTTELYYEITVYLETSVSNEYMDKELIADFRWWVEETDNLDIPKTGDTANLTLWLSLAAGSLVMIVLLWIILLADKRRKEEQSDAQRQ